MTTTLSHDNRQENPARQAAQAPQAASRTGRYPPHGKGLAHKAPDLHNFRMSVTDRLWIR